MVSLNTQRTQDGIKLTFPDGRDAGIICYHCNNPKSPGYFAHMPPVGACGPMRIGTEAAQYDALAWASDDERSRS